MVSMKLSYALMIAMGPSSGFSVLSKQCVTFDHVSALVGSVSGACCVQLVVSNGSWTAECQNSWPFGKTAVLSLLWKKLTSGEYVSLFLISILNIYIYIFIWNLKNHMTTVIIFKEIMQKLANQRKLHQWWDQMHHFFLFFKWQRQLP